jgi:glycosyltransferase involved in cell wall biosynthesis
MVDYSVVVPIYNEEGNISLLDKEIKNVMNKLSKSYEIIYINDGSTDNTLNNLKELTNVIVVNLNRNYGQATALDAGFKTSKGKIVISMDGDMQNDPSDIPKMLKKLKDENLDVVCGWRKKRKDKLGIRILTKVGRFVRRIFVRDDVHDTGCTLRVYRSGVVKTLDIGGEMHRYIIALLRWKGFKIGEIKINHRARASGETKYGYSKAIRGFLDLIYVWFIQKYSQRPLHIFGYISILSFFVGVGIEAFLFTKKIIHGIDLSDNAWFILGFFLLGLSFISFVFGMIFEMMIRIYLNTSEQEKRYYIRNIWRN